MRIVGRTFKCSKKYIDEKVPDNPGNASEAPPVTDEETFDAALAEAGETVEKFYSEELANIYDMNIAQLKELAKKKGIDLGNAKLKGDIITEILEAMSAAESPETE